MLSWEFLKSGSAEWDLRLAGFGDHSIAQSFGWGEHKRDSGWTPLRLVANQDGRILAMAQVLLRRFPLGVALAWVPGGPVGDTDVWGGPFRAAIRSAGGGQLYCRINPMCEFSDGQSKKLLSMGWDRPRHAMLSGQSILLDLTAGDENWLSSINAKHRYYVRKSTGAGLIWNYGNTEKLRRDIGTLTLQLSEAKGKDLQERDARSLESLSRAIPGGVQILIGYAGAEPVTGCLVLIQGAKAHYATAATVGSGRKLSAAYAMIARLRSLLREQRIEELDFGGIHPGSETMQGVDHFKRGFGGREIRYLGEWDWATTSLLGRAANFLIKRRGRRL